MLDQTPDKNLKSFYEHNRKTLKTKFYIEDNELKSTNWYYPKIRFIDNKEHYCLMIEDKTYSLDQVFSDSEVAKKYLKKKLHSEIGQVSKQIEDLKSIKNGLYSSLSQLDK